MGEDKEWKRSRDREWNGVHCLYKWFVCISDLFGGYSVICVMSNCSIADITSKQWRQHYTKITSTRALLPFNIISFLCLLSF